MKRVEALCTTLLLVAAIHTPARAGLVSVDNGTKNLLSIDETTGAATVLSTLDITGIIGGMTLDPTAQVLYGFDSADLDVISINPLTGDVTVVADLSFEMRALAFDQSTNTLYGVDSVVAQKLYTIDTGSGTAIAGPEIDTVNGGIQGMTFDASGNLFATNVIDDVLLEINTSNGTTTELVNLAPDFSQMFSLAFDQSTGSLFGVNSPAGDDELVRFDPAGPSFLDGASVGTIAGSTDIVSLAVAPSLIVVPEPSTFALLSTSLLGICAAGYRWRRKRKTSLTA